jgi:hypothetical protein
VVNPSKKGSTWQPYHTVARNVPFDETFVARVRELQRSMLNTNDDADMDNHDQFIECEEGGEIAKQISEAQIHRLTKR